MLVPFFIFFYNYFFLDYTHIAMSLQLRMSYSDLLPHISTVGEGAKDRGALSRCSCVRSGGMVLKLGFVLPVPFGAWSISMHTSSPN